ncbi:MAG: DUF4397 domain-containing protein, partial [Myxococcota bacterium]
LTGCGSDDEDSSPSGMAGSGGSGGAGGVGGEAGSAGSGGTAGSAGEGGSGGSTQTMNAMVRVVHASPTAPAVDLYAKGSTTPLQANLAYGSATDYLELPEGTYDLEIRAAGADPADPPAFEVSGLSVMGGEKYTAIAAGDLGSTDAADQFRVIPLMEGFANPDEGTIRARIVHASFDAPTVDLDVGNDDPANPELSGLDRFADTGEEGVALPADASLQVGIAAGGSTVTAFTTPALTDRSELFIIATGELSDMPSDASGFALLAVLPDSSTAWIKQNPFVYALHASPDAPAVDIYAGDAELFDNVPFGALGRIQVPGGSYTLDFFGGMAGPTPRPSTAPAASASTPELMAGETYIAIATGLLAGSGDQAFQLFPIAEGFVAPSDGEAVARVVHASPDAPPVDIGTVSSPGMLDANPPIVNVPFPAATDQEGLVLPAETPLTLGVAATGSMATAAEFDVNFADGQKVVAVAAGLLSPSAGEQPFQLLVIDATSTSILDPWGVASLSPNQ